MDELLQHKDHDIESWQRMNHIQNKDKEKAIEEAKHLPTNFYKKWKDKKTLMLSSEKLKKFKENQIMSLHLSQKITITNDMFQRKPTEVILDEMEIQREENKPQEKPEEVKIEDIPVRLDLSQSQSSVSQSTTSHGPTIIGQEAKADIVNQSGNLIFKGTFYKLAGKMYSTLEYVLNLIKRGQSNEIKNFREIISNISRIQ